MRDEKENRQGSCPKAPQSQGWGLTRAATSREPLKSLVSCTSFGESGIFHYDYLDRSTVTFFTHLLFSQVYQVPRAAITRLPPNRVAQSSRNLFSWFWIPEVLNQGVSRAVLSLKALGRTCPTPFSQLLVLLATFDVRLPCGHITIPVPVSDITSCSPRVSSLLVQTPATPDQAHPVSISSHLQLIVSQKPGTFTGPGIRDFKYIF